MKGDVEKRVLAEFKAGVPVTDIAVSSKMTVRRVEQIIRAALKRQAMP